MSEMLDWRIKLNIKFKKAEEWGKTYTWGRAQPISWCRQAVEEWPYGNWQNESLDSVCISESSILTYLLGNIFAS
jgi:hypothetical protein